jgi:hypothetical protein
MEYPMNHIQRQICENSGLRDLRACVNALSDERVREMLAEGLLWEIRKGMTATALAVTLDIPGTEAQYIIDVLEQV